MVETVVGGVITRKLEMGDELLTFDADGTPNYGEIVDVEYRPYGLLCLPYRYLTALATGPSGETVEVRCWEEEVLYDLEVGWSVLLPKAERGSTNA